MQRSDKNDITTTIINSSSQFNQVFQILSFLMTPASRIFSTDLSVKF
jgi:hypothetical protein